MDTTYPAESRSSETDRMERSDTAHQETLLHFVAREAKIVLRWIILISGITAVLTMMTFIFWFWAIVPAIALLFSFLLLALASYVERRTAQPGDPHEETAAELADRRRAETSAPADPERAQQQRIEEAVERKSHRTVVGIIVGIAVAAIVIAGFIFGRELFILGGFILFAYMLLVAAPVWLGWIEDEAEDEAHRLEGRSSG